MKTLLKIKIILPVILLLVGNLLYASVSHFKFYHPVSDTVDILDAVWPGDFNSDGIVNHKDVLFWGVSYDQSGNPRVAASTNWAAQYCLQWDGNTNEINEKHQDGDGNGDVDFGDLSVLVMNYGKSHTLNEDPIPPEIDCSISRFEHGAENELIYRFHLNDENGAIPTHGISGEIDFGNHVIEVIEVELIESCLDSPEFIYHFDEETNKLGIAFTDTDQTDKSCGSDAFKIRIIIADDIVARPPSMFTFNQGTVSNSTGVLTGIHAAAPLTLVTYKSDVNCLTLDSGSAEVEPSGGTGPYNFRWSNINWDDNQTTKEITGLVAGDYYVTVTDRWGIVEERMVSIQPYYEGPTTLENPTIDYEEIRSDHEVTLSSVVAGGASLSVVAEVAITMISGFEVDVGGIFSAQIGECIGGN